jgi:hypothetical protein
MRAHEFITEHKTIEEGRWNEEFLKNLVRALVAGVVAYGGLEAKRLATDYDKAGLDTIVKQMVPAEQNQIVNMAKKAKHSKKIDKEDRDYLTKIINRVAY